MRYTIRESGRFRWNSMKLNIETGESKQVLTSRLPVPRLRAPSPRLRRTTSRGSGRQLFLLAAKTVALQRNIELSAWPWHTWEKASGVPASTRLTFSPTAPAFVSQRAARLAATGRVGKMMKTGKIPARSDHLRKLKYCCFSINRCDFLLRASKGLPQGQLWTDVATIGLQEARSLAKAIWTLGREDL